MVKSELTYGSNAGLGPGLLNDDFARRRTLALESPCGVRMEYNGPVCVLGPAGARREDLSLIDMCG